MYEKGMRAFVSFVQAYAKHECHLIFKFKSKSSFPNKGSDTLVMQTARKLRRDISCQSQFLLHTYFQIPCGIILTGSNPIIWDLVATFL